MTDEQPGSPAAADKAKEEALSPEIDSNWQVSASGLRRVKNRPKQNGA
jgi:hypothetical protein